MKSIKLIFASIFAAALALTACSGSSSDEPARPGAAHSVKLAIDFTLNAAADSRAPRPLESADHLQQVNDMRLYIFRSESGTTDDSFTLFPYPTGSATDYISVAAFKNLSPNPAIEESHPTVINPSLPDGYYRFLAVGCDNLDQSPVEIALSEATTWTSATAAASAPCVSEIFSGYAADGSGSPLTLHVTGSTTLSTTITLRRAVAGVLVNVINIPSEINSEAVDHIELRSAGHGMAVDLVNRAPVSEPAAGPTTLLSVAPSADADRRGLAGAFIFPASLKEHSAGGSTLSLCFLAADGTELLVKPVKIVEAFSTSPTGPEIDYSADGYVSADGMQFDIIANRIYCLGKRYDSTDEPLDLSDVTNTSTLKIEVIGAWQADVNIDL